jgi:hypothetical protein
VALPRPEGWSSCSQVGPAAVALKYLDGPGRWPGRARVLASGCCAGPLGKVVAGNILSEVTALSGRAEPRWVLAGGRQVPSESVARRSRHMCTQIQRIGRGGGSGAVVTPTISGGGITAFSDVKTTLGLRVHFKGLFCWGFGFQKKVVDFLEFFGLDVL